MKQESPKQDMVILRRQELESKIGLKRSTIYAMLKAGELPRPIRLGARSIGWIESEIEAWLRERAAKRAA